MKTARKLFWFIGLTLALTACKDDGSEPGNNGGNNGGGSTDPVVAFPGAEGGGAYVTGGRGERIIVVNTPDDTSGAKDRVGTLRNALQGTTGKRIIIFNFSGVIELQSDMVIKNGDFTILGQSAPGDGICIKGQPIMLEGAQNVIIRFLRFRLGDDKLTNPDEGDALTVKNCKNVIIDHCSFSWSTDECMSAYDNENFTLQWCIISESLRLSKHGKGAHGYGGMWGGQNASFHHNLLAHHDSRNPRFNGARSKGDVEKEKVDFRNNVIYNWGGNSGYGGEGGYYNMVNNYYKPSDGTSTGEARTRIFAPDSDPGGNGNGLNNKPTWGKFYVSGNYMEGQGANWDWNGIHPKPTEGRDGTTDGSTIIPKIKLTEEITMPAIKPQTAQEAYNSVLNKAGASLKLDKIDRDVIDEVRSGVAPVRAFYSVEPQASQPLPDRFADGRGRYPSRTRPGMIDNPMDVGGWDTYISTPAADINRDGIPDSWETARGVAKGSIDAKAATLNPPYTNLEVYLNDIVKDLY
jgi:hypothetical protein